MPGPHDHQQVIAQLRSAEKEVKAMSVKPRARVEKITEELGHVIEAEEEYDLDAELDRMTAEMAQEEEVPVPEEEPVEAGPAPDQALRDQILTTLRDRPDAPSPAQIQSWKEKYGDESVQLMALDKKNVFVFTYLTWSQWDKVQKLATACKQKTGDSEEADRAMTEAVIRTAVLWPKLGPDWFKDCPAGVPSTLAEQIKIGSYFLTPQVSMMLTVRL